METKELFTIQPLSNEHSHKAVSLILPIQQLEFNVPVTIQDQPDLFDIEGVYHRSGGGFWGAMVKDELVGTIALINVGHNAGVIRKMFVKKEYRGKEFGIAQKLFEVLLDFCRQKNITDLYLGTVERLQAARRFYERNGFGVIAAADLPPYFLRMAVDNVFYHLSAAK